MKRWIAAILMFLVSDASAREIAAPSPRLHPVALPVVPAFMETTVATTDFYAKNTHIRNCEDTYATTQYLQGWIRRKGSQRVSWQDRPAAEVIDAARRSGTPWVLFFERHIHRDMARASNEKILCRVIGGGRVHLVGNDGEIFRTITVDRALIEQHGGETHAFAFAARTLIAVPQPEQ